MNDQCLFPKVLLLEDDDSHALIIKRSLREYSGQVTHCRSVKEANSALETGSFDLLITDLHLPDSQGVAHVKSFKQQNPLVPLIVLTSSTDLRLAVEAMKEGASEFIVKNFDVSFSEVLNLSLSRIFSHQQLKADQERVQREIEVLRVAIDNSHDAMAVFNRSGAKLYSNRAFATFVQKCGGTAEKIFDIFSPNVTKHEELGRSLQKNLEQLPAGGIWHSEVNYLNEKDLAYDISLSVIGNDCFNSAQHHYVLWVKDISEEKRREKFQREILSTTTHDLKGPLGAIIISCELLAELVKGQDKVSQLVMRVESSARGSVNLIDEFLSARRIQEGTFILKPSEQNIIDTIQEVLGDYRTIAASRSINLRFSADAERIDVVVDKLALSRVVGNLLSNSLKFTPKGGSVQVVAGHSENDYHIAVIDSGCGMDVSEVQKLFGRFARLDKHSDIVGSGLGLFVVKSLVNAHGGKVEVTSTVGQGTRIEIYMPKKPQVDARGVLIALDFT